MSPFYLVLKKVRGGREWVQLGGQRLNVNPDRRRDAADRGLVRPDHHQDRIADKFHRIPGEHRGVIQHDVHLVDA